ncbi:MAG TPA: NAD-dependent epimerase/dehydratase family protein [Candidatus Limnocylindria bacterium]|nr:NAD-dependent epimerase/dehydratase family protein [Candidatus Limnocylindria bacterium]
MIRVKLRLPASVHLTRASLDDVEALAEAFAGADAVAHLAGINRERGDATYEAVHVQGTRNVVAAAQRVGVPGSSCSVSCGPGRIADPATTSRSGRPRSSCEFGRSKRPSPAYCARDVNSHRLRASAKPNPPIEPLRPRLIYSSPNAMTREQ